MYLILPENITQLKSSPHFSTAMLLCSQRKMFQNALVSSCCIIAHVSMGSMLHTRCLRLITTVSHVWGLTARRCFLP